MSERGEYDKIPNAAATTVAGLVRRAEAAERELAELRNSFSETQKSLAESIAREAAFLTHHCESEGCAVEGEYTTKAARWWADQYHAMKAELAKVLQQQADADNERDAVEEGLRTYAVTAVGYLRAAIAEADGWLDEARGIEPKDLGSDPLATARAFLNNAEWAGTVPDAKSHETCRHPRVNQHGERQECAECHASRFYLGGEQWDVWLPYGALRHQSGKKPELLACPFCKEGGYSPIGLHLHFVNDWCPEYGDVMDAAETEAFGVERHQVGRDVEAVEKLLADIDRARGMIGKMCSDGRPPKMSIPARPDVDEDLVICDTLVRVSRFLREHHLQSVACNKQEAP